MYALASHVRSVHIANSCLGSSA